MIVAVVDVRIMGRRVPVRMRMRLAGVPREIVMVVVMGVVAMLVRVFDLRMLMLCPPSIGPFLHHGVL